MLSRDDVLGDGVGWQEDYVRHLIMREKGGGL